MQPADEVSVVVPRLSDWALRVVSDQRPEEANAFATLAEPYLTSEGSLRARVRGGRGEDALGSGLEVAAFVTPMVLFMCNAAWKVLMGAAQESASQGLSQLFGRLRRRHHGQSYGSDGPVVVTVETLRKARRQAREVGLEAGLAEEKASAMADAVIGVLLEQPQRD